MSNFYLKINKHGNELEFSTDDERAFDEKLQQILNSYSNTTISCDDNNKNVVAEAIGKQDNMALCDFVDIVPPNETINNLNDKDRKTNTLTAEFEEILDKAQETPTINFVEPENNNVEFQSFIVSQNPQSQMDYLIFTAQFFVKYLNLQNFTLKQINSKLYPSQNVAVSNKTLNEAIELGYIKLLPDLTQTSINKEYCLTQSGEYEYRQ